MLISCHWSVWNKMECDVDTFGHFMYSRWMLVGIVNRPIYYIGVSIFKHISDFLGTHPYISREWGGGARVVATCQLFLPPRMPSLLAIMYVTIWCFFWSTYFS